MSAVSKIVAVHDTKLNKIVYRCYFGHISHSLHDECMHCCKGATIDELNKFIIERKAILLNHNKQFYKSSEQVEIECEKKHRWKTSYLNLKFKDRWCPFCSKYKTEKIVRAIFEEMYKSPFPSVRYDWLNGLELDGYSDDLKIAFEYSGEQHFKYIPFFHKQYADFILLQRRDTIKKNICDKRNIKLIIIPYTVDIDNMREFIKNS